MVLQPPAGVLLTAVAAVLYPQAAAGGSPPKSAEALSSITFTATTDVPPHIPAAEPATVQPRIEAPVCTPAEEGSDRALSPPPDDDAAPAPPVDASNRDGWAPAAHGLAAQPAPGTWVAKWGSPEKGPPAAPPADRKPRRVGRGGKKGGGGRKPDAPEVVGGGQRGTKSEEVDNEALRRQQDWARGTFSEPNPLPLGESLFAWVGMAAQQVAPAVLEKEMRSLPAATPSAAPAVPRQQSSTLPAALLSRAAATVGGSTHDPAADEFEDAEEAGEQETEEGEEEDEEGDRLSALRQPMSLPSSTDISVPLSPIAGPVRAKSGPEPSATGRMTPPRSELNWWCCPELQVDNAAADNASALDTAAPDTRYLDLVRQTQSEDGRRANPYPHEVDRDTHSEDISYYDWVKMPTNQPTTPAGAHAVAHPATRGQRMDAQRGINSINWVAMESVQHDAQFGAVAARKLFAGHTPRHSAIAEASFPSLASKLQQEAQPSESDSQTDSVTDEESSHDGDSLDSASSAPSAWGVEGWDAHREAVLKEAQRLVGAANADGGTWRWYGNGWC